MVDDMGGFSSDDPEGKWYYEDQTGLEVDFNEKTVHVLWN
jgi:hypothetical protein